MNAVDTAKLSLRCHALDIVQRMEARDSGARRYSASAQGSDARRMAAIAGAFGVDADPLFIDGGTVRALYRDIFYPGSYT